MGTGRALSFVAVAWIGLTLVAALRALWPLARVPGPDVVLIVVVFAALTGRGGPAAVGGIAAFLGYLADLYAGSPKGLHVIAYLLAGLFARAFSSRLMVRGALPSAVLLVFFAAGVHGVTVLLRAFLAVEPLTALRPRAFLPVPLVVITTAVFAPGLFRLLGRIDAAFARDPRELAATR